MSDTPNASERDFWSGPVGQSWVNSQEEMDMQLAEVADLVMHHANPQPGHRVIDIGAGAGALSLLAAKAVGPSGHVLTTDISQPLLDCAGSRGQGLSQMQTFLGDAQTADWPGSRYDIAISRFGVMFFADPIAAFANIARALKPGGRIVFAAWAPAKENPSWQIPTRHAVARLGQPPKTEPNTPGPMGLADIRLAKDRLHQAGLTDVKGQTTTVHQRHPGGANAFAKLCMGAGSAKRAIVHFDATPEDQQAIEAAIAQDFAQYESSGGCAIPAAINLLTATRPA